jgi:hypothetical protein
MPAHTSPASPESAHLHCGDAPPPSRALSANPSSAPVYHAQVAMQTAAGSVDGLMHASLYQVLFNIPKVC